MAKPAKKEGRGPCPNCGEPVTFKRSGGGKLTFTCDADECDSSGYAEPGSGMEKKWLASITKKASAAPEPEPGPAPAPAKPAKAAAFSIGSL
jgi:hypothetical protein